MAVERILLSWAALLGLNATLVAQEAVPAQPQQGYNWALNGLERAFCVDFLMDTALARKNVERVFKEYRPLPAGRVPDLHPAMDGVIRRDSSYADWVPSRLCLIGARTVEADGRIFSEEGDGGREMVGFWAIAAVPADEWADPSDPGLMAAPVVFGSNHRLTRAAEVAGLEADRYAESWGMVPESETEERYEAKVKKAEMRWEGHLASPPDSAFALVSRFIMKGKRNVPWLVTVDLAPESARPMVGAFTVHGKDDLAKALQGSPIRMLTPMMWGGSGEFLFFR